MNGSGSAGGNPCRYSSGREERGRGATQEQGTVGRETVRDPRERSAEDDRQCQTGGDTGQHYRTDLNEDQAADLRGPGAERHANADLTRAAGDVATQNGEQSDRGE